MKKIDVIKKTLSEVASCESIKDLSSKQFFDEVCKIYAISSINATLDDKSNTIVNLYSSNFKDAEKVSAEGETGDGKWAKITCCIRAGEHLDEKDKSDLEFMCKMIYVIMGKLRLADIAEKFYFYDTATDLPNLNYLIRHGNKLIAMDEICNYTAYFINIKDFNYINKKVGYKYGVDVFSAYGKELGKHLEKMEILARLGGDNFVMLAKKGRDEEIINLLCGIEISLVLNNEKHDFTIRARASIYPIDKKPEQFGVVMNHISPVMGYGRNVLHKDFVYCTPEIEKAIMRSKSFGQMFANAIENGEFYVVYQPKVLVTNNSLYGGEALVRWESDGKIHSPAEFIETLEREHLICKLDYYVLEQTCKMLRECIDNGQEVVRISVNFSKEHLNNDKFVENITNIVDKYKIAHRYIEIEVTETVDCEESRILSDYVNDLQANGFTVAMDDFGIGYSSLNLLKNVPVDVLKIDKEFITELNSDSNQREKIIIRNIINMASELGIEVVAEGVETKLQIELLKNMSCQRIQGFIFDRPLSKEDFVLRLEEKTYDGNSSK